VQAVYDELMVGNGDLAAWARQHNSIFLKPTDNDLTAVKAVQQWANSSSNYDAVAKHEFVSKADSFLIAHAMAGDHIVVTHERTSNSRRKIKIPNAARANNVNCRNPFEMLRPQGARFVLDNLQTVHRAR